MTEMTDRDVERYLMAFARARVALGSLAIATERFAVVAAPLLHELRERYLRRVGVRTGVQPYGGRWNRWRMVGAR